MADEAAHRGVAADDPRNRAPIAFFAPQPVTPASARAALLRSRPGAPPEEIERRVSEVMERIAKGPVKPPPPLSQTLDRVEDPLYGLGTHPDIVARLWKLDEALPRSSRFVFWGKPALVHPETGVVFAVGFGTIGIVMRLPPPILAAARAEEASAIRRGNPGQSFDISGAGPEWRFVAAAAPEAAWCRAAYDFAGLVGD